MVTTKEDFEGKTDDSPKVIDAPNFTPKKAKTVFFSRLGVFFKWYVFFVNRGGIYGGVLWYYIVCISSRNLFTMAR